MDIPCGADASARFDLGLALLHNFAYERALTEFDATIKAHPDCAIAYWGAAMTYSHPPWSQLTTTDVKVALAVLERAKQAGTRNDREAKYVAAVTTLFGRRRSAEKGRATAYGDAMRATLAAYRDDETQLFTSLAIQSVAHLPTTAGWKPGLSKFPAPACIGLQRSLS